jgi:Tol biopolymer transport system component
VTLLVSRSDARESLGAPAWLPDGSGLFFQREDDSTTGVAYPGGSTVYYPSRIEAVQADGTNRTVVVGDGRQPAASPDGASLVFVRTADTGAAMYERSLADGSERPLVAAGRFREIAYPRFSPAGDRVAFMASGAFVGLVLASWPLAPESGRLHGVPWDLWVMAADGSAVGRLAELGADDASVSWSPSGTQLFVYGGTGSFLVDAASGQTTPLPYVAGYGGTSWLP